MDYSITKLPDVFNDAARQLKSGFNRVSLALVLVGTLSVADNYSNVTQAADFELLVNLRQGAQMYHKKRFADAEVLFDKVYRSLKNDPDRDEERYTQLLDFLAQSKSLQGKNAVVVPLMEERLAISTKIHGEGSDKLSPMLAGIAEAYYRDDQRDNAIATVKMAIDGLKRLEDSSDYLKLAENNLERYVGGPFTEDELPMDLSEFYTHCESIERGDLPSVVSSKMSGFSEVGVDYKPEGFWASMFTVATLGRDGSARTGNKYRRIFIPASDREEVRADVCVVDQLSGIVVSADNTVD